MDNETYIPSEMIEPALVKWFSTFIECLGMFDKCPPEEWWKEWKLKASGVSMLLIIISAPHANIAFSNQVLRPIICPSCWQKTWECAREAVAHSS